VQTPISPANPGRVERRNSPTLLNVGYNKVLIWDGRAWPLERQALGSTKNPIHKGHEIDRLMKMLNEYPEMVRMFAAGHQDGGLGKAGGDVAQQGAGRQNLV